MSIFDMFSSPKPQPPAQPQPGNIPEGAGQGATVPNAPPTPAPEENSDPLAKFKDLWEPVQDSSQQSSDTFVPLDPTKLQEVVGKASFTNGLSQENMQAIANGGEDAVRAFQDSMNAVAQQVMMQATLASNKMTEQAVKQALAAQEAKFPSMIKQHNTSEQLSAANPLFSNPAVKPVLEAVRSQLQAKNPNASSSEIAQMAQDFINVMGEQFAPKPASSAQPDSVDWEKFLSA